MKLYSGIDWLTLIGEDEAGTSQQMYETVAWMEKLESEHGSWRDWKFRGYKGQTCGPLSAGFNQDNFIICISGAAANDAEKEIPSLPQFRATRVDYQVTVQLDDPDPGLAGEAFYHLQKINEVRKNKRTLAYYSSNSETLYVNKRSSPIVLRLYDRTMRMGKEWEDQVGVFWRYEVEYKRDYAPIAFGAWLKNPNRTGHIRDTVNAEFAARDVSCRFDSGDQAESIVVSSGKTTVASNLSWLTKTVRPVVGRLIVAGYEFEVLQALGLNREE